MISEAKEKGESYNIKEEKTDNSELFCNLSKSTPHLDSAIYIHIPIMGGHKKESLASCGFGTLKNRLEVIDIDMTEKEIQQAFLSKTPNFFQKIKKGYRNLFGTDPGALQKGLNMLLDTYNKPLICKKKNGLTFDEIVSILQTGQPIMVQYTRQQDTLFQTLKKKNKTFDACLGDKGKYFTYGYPHYGLLVGIDGKDNIVEILNPDTGDIEKIPFQLRWSQFCLERPHQGLLFHGARKMGLMKPQMGIYFEKTE